MTHKSYPTGGKVSKQSEEKGQQYADALNMLEDVFNKAFENGYEQAIEDMLKSIRDIADSLSANRGFKINNRGADWPELDKNVLWFNGKRANLRGSRFVALLQKLLEAKGEIIPTTELLEFYGGKDALKPAIYSLRKNLAKKMPEVEIISAGNGYRISINYNLT